MNWSCSHNCLKMSSFHSTDTLISLIKTLKYLKTEKKGEKTETKKLASGWNILIKLPRKQIF